MTLDNWDALQLQGESLSGQNEKTLNLLQVDDKADSVDVLHVWGNTAFLESNITKVCLITLSTFAATAYVCQYAIIKGVGYFPEF